MYYNRYLQWIVIIYMTSCHCSAVFPTFTGRSTLGVMEKKAVVIFV